MSSTYSLLMKNKSFTKLFAGEYKKLVLSEMICALMEEDSKSVRKLAKEVGLTPSFIQNLRTGKQKDLKLSNFLSISENFGYEVVLKNRKSKEEIHLSSLLHNEEDADTF